MIPLAPKGLPEYVLDWDDGRKYGDSIIVTLKPGWCFDLPNSEAHTAGFDNVREARQGLRTVYGCSCERCTEGKG